MLQTSPPGFRRLSHLQALLQASSSWCWSCLCSHGWALLWERHRAGGGNGIQPLAEHSFLRSGGKTRQGSGQTQRNQGAAGVWDACSENEILGLWRPRATDPTCEVGGGAGHVSGGFQDTQAEHQKDLSDKRQKLLFYLKTGLWAKETETPPGKSRACKAGM